MLDRHEMTFIILAFGGGDPGFFGISRSSRTFSLDFFSFSPKGLFDVSIAKEVANLFSQGYTVLRDMVEVFMVSTPFGLVLQGGGFVISFRPSCFVYKILHIMNYT